MLTLTLCTAVLFLLALIGLVLVAVGLPFAALFFALLPLALLPVGAVMLFLGLIRTPRQVEQILPGLVVFLLGLALFCH